MRKTLTIALSLWLYQFAVCGDLDAWNSGTNATINVGTVQVRGTNAAAEMIVTNGLTLGGVRNTSWPSGGIAMGVSNNVAASGLLAVDATKTNGIAATAAHITNAWGIFTGDTTKAVSGAGTLISVAVGDNWTASGTTNSTLSGFASAYGSQLRSPTNTAYTATTPQSFGKSDATYNLFQYFEGKDSDPAKSGSWFFGQSISSNPAPDTDTEKSWSWGFNAVGGNIQNTNEHSFVWNLETLWDPSGGSGPSGPRQMEFYNIFNARSNAFGARVENLVMREANDAQPVVIQKEYNVSSFTLSGAGATNSGAVVFNLGYSANAAASMTIRGVIYAQTNATGQGGFEAYGGGYTARNNDGSKYISLTTDNATGNYTLTGNDFNARWVIDGLSNITTTARMYFPDGTVALPAIAFENAKDRGFFKTANGIAYGQSGARFFEFESNQGILMHPGTWLAWASAGGGTTADTSVSRISAGVIGAGTGGNNASAKFSAASYLAGGVQGITTTWTNVISGVITQRISTIGGIVVTNLTL